MDAFESVVASILEREGFWTRTSFKVELTREDKIAIDRPSSPRWEIDVLAYRPSDNRIWVVECKSYLDSYGVRLESFEDSESRTAKRYKLFNEASLRKVVFRRLRSQLKAHGLIQPSAKLTLCLAAGRFIRSSDRDAIRRLFKRRGWLLFDDDWIRERLGELVDSGYENSTITVVAKLLMRQPR